MNRFIQAVLAKRSQPPRSGYSCGWNPAVEQQAADRAYRLGQKKGVQVIKLISQGAWKLTEEGIRDILDI